MKTKENIEISAKDLETVNSIKMGLDEGLSYKLVRSMLMYRIEQPNFSKRGKRLDRLYNTYIKEYEDNLNEIKKPTCPLLVGKDK